MTEEEAYAIWLNRLGGKPLYHPGGPDDPSKGERYVDWRRANSGRYTLPITFDKDECLALLNEMMVFCRKANLPHPRDSLQWLQDTAFHRCYGTWIKENNIIAKLGLVPDDPDEFGHPKFNRDNTIFFPFHQHAVLFKLRWIG